MRAPKRHPSRAARPRLNAAGELIDPDDVYGLLEALPPMFRQNATWQLELSTANFIRRLYNLSGTEPALIEGNNLIGLPFVLNSSADPYSAVNPAASASNMVLFVGDWAQYVILDRIGTSVFFIPPGVLQNTANKGRRFVHRSVPHAGRRDHRLNLCGGVAFTGRIR
jgi:predicted phage gp36 major capsid-like protein